MGQSSSQLPDEVRRQFPSFETGRELQELFIAARLSSIAYGEDRNIPHQLRDAARHPWFSPSEFQKSLDKSPQKLFLMTDETTLYVTFCGTQSWTDLSVDLSATLSPSSLLSGALVHHGMIQAVANFQDQIFTQNIRICWAIGAYPLAEYCGGSGTV